jgi:peptidylprolyl isomerase
MLNRTPLRILITASIAVAAACNPRDAAPTKSIPPPPDVAAAPADARRSSSGLAWKMLSPGTGTRHPRPNSEVTVHYTGWTSDGMMFESSVKNGKPVSFPLTRVIAGWTEGVQMMVEGEKRRFWIPPGLAYGDSPTGDQPKGMLVFDIELIRIDN